MFNIHWYIKGLCLTPGLKGSYIGVCLYKGNIPTVATTGSTPKSGYIGSTDLSAVCTLNTISYGHILGAGLINLAPRLWQ